MSDLDNWQDVGGDVPVETQVDAELLISEIHSHPVLWNTMYEGYKDRIKREEAWQEIFHELSDDYAELSESNKKLFGKSIQGKWKNIKDTYRKHKHAIRLQAGTSAKKKKKYVYEDKLRFLDNTQKFISKVTNKVNNHYEDEPIALKPPPIQFKRKKPVEERVLEYLEDRTQRDVGDEHQAFFNSLVSTVRGFSEDEVLEFRASVIKIAQDIRKRRVLVRQ